MARADYREQMKRHAGEYDVLPRGLIVPSLPAAGEWGEGFCTGRVVLTDEFLEGNRWPAVSGALLAELAYRCAMLAALTRAEPDRFPRPREISVRLRKAIPVADPREHPRVADGGNVLLWRATAEQGTSPPAVGLEITRPNETTLDAPVVVEARAVFDAGAMETANDGVEARMARFLSSLPRRMVLPAYHSEWTEREITGECVEEPGSLLAVAEQALGEAGKIVRGDGVPPELEESMLLADMTYRWLADVTNARVTYVSRPGPRRTDAKGRDWLDATAVLSAGGRPVAEASGSIVLQRFRPRER